MANKGNGKGNSKGGMSSNPFGRMFDFNRDGKTDARELYMSYLMFEQYVEMKEESKRRRGSSWSGSSYSPDYSWREDCEEGFHYDLDPAYFATKKEYDAALDMSKNEWRWKKKWNDYYLKYYVSPFAYETEEKYQEALTVAMTAWREKYKDGENYGINPDDYIKEEEYTEALKKAKERMENKAQREK